MADILILGKYYHPFEGGIESNTKYVADYLAARHRVTAIVFSHEGRSRDEMIDGVRVRRCATALVVKSQPLSLRMVALILRAKADVVHFHAPNVLANAALLTRLLLGRRMPVVVTHHMDIFGRPLLRGLARRLYDRLLDRTDKLIVTSVKNAKVSSDIRRPCALEAIPLGIDLQDYVLTDEDRAGARRWRRELAGDAPLVGFVGRHARYKGLDLIVRAVASIAGLHAALAGDGPYRAATEALAAELGVSDRVHFLGKISHREKLRLLCAIDAFVFPSTEITEAFGVSQVEAMAVGAPVIASDLPTGVTDVAIADETALVVSPGDHGALAAAIRRLLDDPALGRRIAENAIRFVHEKLTRELVVARTAAVIEDVLASRVEKPGKLKQIVTAAMLRVSGRWQARDGNGAHRAARGPTR